METNEIFGASKIVSAMKRDLEKARKLGDYEKEFKKAVQDLEDLFEIAKKDYKELELLRPREIEQMEVTIKTLKEIDKRLSRAVIAKKFGL